DHPLAAQFVRLLEEFGVVRFEDDLREAVAVAEVHEHLFRVIAGDEHPAIESDGLPDVFVPKLAAGLRPLPLGHGSPRFRIRYCALQRQGPGALSGVYGLGTPVWK